MFMRQVKAGHLYNTTGARPVETIEGRHETITLYRTRSKRFFLHIVGDMNSLCAGYDKDYDCLTVGEKILPVSWGEAQQIMTVFKEREQKDDD